MRKILLSLLVLVAGGISFGTHAANIYRSIMLDLTDGTFMLIAMESDMNVTMENGEVVMSSGKGDIRMPISDIQHWTFSSEAGANDLWAGIEDVDNTPGVEVEKDVNYIRFKNLPSNSKLMLAGIDGKVYGTWTADGYFELPLSGLNGGVYLLSYNGKTIKIAVGK